MTRSLRRPIEGENGLKFISLKPLSFDHAWARFEAVGSRLLLWALGWPAHSFPQGSGSSSALDAAPSLRVRCRNASAHLLLLRVAVAAWTAHPARFIELAEARYNSVASPDARPH